MTITDAKLYELRNDILRVLAESDDSGEVTDQQSLQLADLGLSLDDKIDSIIGYAKRLEAERAGRQAVADQIQAEANRHRAAVRAIDNRIDGLKRYLLGNLEMLGLRAHKTRLHSVWAQTSQSAECVVEPEALPERFRRVKVEADRKAALDEFKATGQVPDGFAIRHGSTLRIG